jgi:ABC-2 type transport system permease protein
MTENLGVTRSVWLVARREFRSRVRSRTVLACTVPVALLLIVFVVLQTYVFDQSRPLRIGLAGQAISLQVELPQDMARLGLPVTARSVDSVAEGVTQVRHGKLDVLVYGARAALRVTIDNQLDPRLRATLNSQVRQQVLDAQIAQLGARPNDVLAKVDQAQIAVTQLNTTDPNLGPRVAVGIVTALLLAWSVLVFAMFAARGVDSDATSGTAEALLTILRPRRLLSGNLGGTGLTGLAHVAAIGVIGLIVVLGSGATNVPSAVVIAFGAGLVGFVVGFGLYGLAAVVGVSIGWSSTRRALASALGVVVVLSVVVLGVDPVGPAAAVLSVLPPFAPILLPAALAAGVAAGWQLPVGLVLALLTVGALAWFTAQTYPKSLLRG